MNVQSESKRTLVKIEYGPCFDFPKTCNNRKNYTIFPDVDTGRNFHLMKGLVPKNRASGNGLYYGFMVMKYSDGSQQLRKFRGRKSDVHGYMAYFHATQTLLISDQVRRAFGNPQNLPQIKEVVGPFEVPISKEESCKLLEANPALYLEPNWPPIARLEYDVVFVNGKKVIHSFKVEEYLASNAFGKALSARLPFFARRSERC